MAPNAFPASSLASIFQASTVKGGLASTIRLERSLRFQTKAVVSLEADASNLPSGEKASSWIGPM